MELSPQEKARIYEEEKTRREAQERLKKETDLAHTKSAG